MTDKVGMKARTGPPTMEPGIQYLNPGEEAQMEIYGYSLNQTRRAITWVFIFLTVGFLRLVFYWKPEWYLRCTHSPCNLRDAETVLLRDIWRQWFVSHIKYTTSMGTKVKVKDNTALYVRQIEEGGDGKSKIEVDNDSKVKDGTILKFFTNKKVKYMWNNRTDKFEKLTGLEVGHQCSYFHSVSGVTTQSERSRRQVLYGSNAISVHVTPILKILFTQLLNPFYVFQIFSVILWYNDEYEYYATTIILISAISLGVTLYETRKMQRALKSTVTASGIVSVHSGNEEFQDIPSDLLVPGDIIEVPRYGCMMQCDAVLISGNCIVNESMLTGESVPVTKTPVPNPRDSLLFDMKEHSRHVLFCGTHVIQTRYYGNQKVKAVVLRTGFATAKGELVRSIMFPKPVDFKFTQDAFKFIVFLAGVAAIGMIFTMVIMVQRGDKAGHIILRTLDLITIVIPPALPAAMTVGIVFAQNRLKRQKVFCISPRSINLCGALNVFCFDKTGTLTGDGLDMWGVIPVRDKHYEPVVKEVQQLNHTDRIMAAMATCHSLTIIEGEINGDPLDLIMFQFTSWELEEPGEDATKYDVLAPTIVHPKKPDLIKTSQTYISDDSMPYEIGVIRQFTFSSRLQRMSVITRTLGSQHFDLYAKGAPEMIASLALPETVPSNFHEELTQYTQQGYRVIALAWKPLKMSYVKAQRTTRDQVEKELTFLGLLVMENRLKPETTPIIRQLKQAAIRTVMVTGDNMLTALSVARDCSMIERKDKVIFAMVTPSIGNQAPSIEWTYAEDTKKNVTEVQPVRQDSMVLDIEYSDQVHFAITGKSWDLLKQHFPEILPRLVVRGTVFARMSPEQKMQLIETLQDVGYYVGMCGDGANDCGALKTAHAGISLSEAEASVASPFTSKEPNISCVPTTIKEGRAALVTSFGVFKYMACYSLTQFFSVTLLYWIGANLTDFGFLWIDLVLLTSLSITFGYTKAYPQLVPKAPPVSLISLTPIMSIISQMVVIIAFQFFTWELLKAQSWFEPFVPNDDDDYACHEVTAVFCVSSFQYISLAIVFSKGAPYRSTIFTNYVFMINLALVLAGTAYITLYPFQWLEDLLEMVLPPNVSFRGILIGIAVLNFFICFLVETFLIDSKLMKTKCHEPIKNKFKKTAFEYQNIEEEFKTQPDWPPISASTNNLAELMRLESVASGLTVDAIDIEEDLKSNSRKKGDPGGDWEPLESNRAPDNRRSFNTGSGSGDTSQPDSPPQSPRDDKTPLLEDTSTVISEKSSPSTPQDRSVPLLNQVGDSSASLVRNSSLDTSPLVDNDQSHQPAPINLETTSL